MAIHELKRTLYQDQPDSTSINHETRDHLQDSTHFHLPALHMHHANLHHWGIASGLSVEQTGPAQLTIKEGLAMDLEGRLIPLASIGEEIGQPGKAFINTTSNLVDVPVVFPIGSSVADGSYYLTIELPLQVTDTAGVIEGRLVTEGRSRRIISTPLIRLQPAVVPFSDHGKAIILATVVIAGGLVTSLNGSSDRQLAGVTVGKIIFKKGGEVGAGPEVGDESAGGISCDRFGLSVTVPDTAGSVLFLAERGNLSRFGVNADELYVENGNLLLRFFGEETVRLLGEPGSLEAKNLSGIHGDPIRVTSSMLVAENLDVSDTVTAGTVTARTFTAGTIRGGGTDVSSIAAGTVEALEIHVADHVYVGGSMHVVGTVWMPGLVTKSGGGFQIDDPRDPANSYLYHSFVESPDMMNVYNGNVTTDADGNATVELPGYFEALNRDFRYQLTVIGEFAQAIVAEEVRDNRFSIRTDRPNVRVSWQVTGIRQDAWANAHRIEAEVQKPEDVRGKYLTPREYDQPETAGISYIKLPVSLVSKETEIGQQQRQQGE